MAVFPRPRLFGFDRCPGCGNLVWRCHLQDAGVASIDPSPSLEGVFAAGGDGLLRQEDPDGLVARYHLHMLVCPVASQHARERRLREAVEHEVAEALEEGRRPPAIEQLPLLPPPPSPELALPLRPGWVDLTIASAGLQARRKPWNGVVVVHRRKTTRRRAN
jgi:hypothetical protein